MNIILLERIQNLGELGDEVKVKAGYGRNYLIPQGKAVPATPDNRVRFEERRAELEKAAADAKAAAQIRADKADGATVQITRKASEEGKLFGSVSVHDIEQALQEAGFDISKNEIHMPEGPLKEVGDFQLNASFHPEVSCHFIVSVIGEA